nr:TctD-like protein [Rhodomonas sp. NIES-1006]
MNVSVLLIDDEVKLLEALGKYLESKGIKVFTAQSTIEAFKILQFTIPDILIVDVMMPSQTGYDFILQLKKNERFGMIPFIFLTAKGMAKDRIQGYRLGCRAYISKPFDPEELISVIKNIIVETGDINNVRYLRSEIKKIRLLLENKSSNSIDLTPGEKLVLLGIIEGCTNQEISNKTKISIRNVEKYVTRLLSKTRSKRRTDLIKSSYKFYWNKRANDENRTRE